MRESPCDAANTSLPSKYSLGFSIWNHLTPPRYCCVHLAWIRLKYEVDLSKQRIATERLPT